MNIRLTYNLLVMIGITVFITSLFSPLLSISEFYIFTNTLSIYSALHTLFAENEWLLFWIILIFAIVLPAVKYSLLVVIGIVPNMQSDNRFKFLESISKWAMLDVFVIAVIVASVKLKVLASAQTHYGLYLFVTAVLLSMICAGLQKYIIVQD